METAMRKGLWTTEEDLTLANYVTSNGLGTWDKIACAAGLRRTGKSCRLRWLNYLRPDTRRGNFTAEEHLLIVELQGRWGNRWSEIARHLPGRTDNEIKNFWRIKIKNKPGSGEDGVVASARQQGGWGDDLQLGYAVQGGGGGGAEEELGFWAGVRQVLVSHGRMDAAVCTCQTYDVAVDCIERSIDLPERSVVGFACQKLRTLCVCGRHRDIN